MNLSHLEKADNYEVARWLTKELNLTAYQKECLYGNETIRLSMFSFYKDKKKVKTSFVMRSTVIVFPIYYVFMLAFASLRYITIGRFGLPQTLIEKFHLKWLSKMGF